MNPFIDTDKKTVILAKKYFSEKKFSCGKNVLCEKSADLLYEFMMTSGKNFVFQNIQEFREQCFARLVDPLFKLAKLNFREKFELEKKLDQLFQEWKKLPHCIDNLQDRIIADCYKWILEI